MKLSEESLVKLRAEKEYQQLIRDIPFDELPKFQPGFPQFPAKINAAIQREYDEIAVMGLCRN